MKADTVKYIGLQRVYRQKALSDLSAVKKRVNDILDGDETVISDEVIETFCKNAGHIKVIQYRSISSHYKQADKIGIKKVCVCFFIFINVLSS